MLQKPPFLLTLQISHDLPSRIRSTHQELWYFRNSQTNNCQLWCVLAQDSQVQIVKHFSWNYGAPVRVHMESLKHLRATAESLFICLPLCWFKFTAKKETKSKDSHRIVTNHWPKISTLYRPEPTRRLDLISYIIRPCFSGPLGGVWSMAMRQHSSG